MVLMDRLGKGVILVLMPTIDALAIAKAFIRFFGAYNGLPRSIVSNQVTNFVAQFCVVIEINGKRSNVVMFLAT
jgi:hypothetical protein